MYHFRVTVSYFSKVAILNYISPVFGTPLGRPHLNFANLWQWKTRFPELVWCCLCDPRLSRFDTMPACDRRTDT